MILNFITISIIILASILGLKKKYTPAYYFIGAFFFMGFAVTMYGLRSLGIIKQSIFTINIFNIGLVSQSLLLSFAVLDRFRRNTRDSNLLLKKQKKEIELQRDKAQESERLKSAFLSNMSHEIRTPLNSVVGFSGFMTDTDIADEQKKTFVKLINNNAKVLLRLIDDILDLAKIETGELKISESECKINTMLEEMYEGFIEERNRYESKNTEIYLRKDIEDEEFIIITDPIRLQQVFFNLMQNAIKFTEKGTIEYGYLIKNNDEIEFYVNDTGKGLPSDKIQVIFEKFRKIDDDKSKIYSGVGMGLTISKNLISLLGGNIEVESELGKGTKVRFTLPLKTVKNLDEYKKKSNNSASELSLEDKNILIVEDEEDNYVLLKGILRKTGAKILRAANGQTALEIIKSNDLKIDIIFMDLKMPVLDGFEATRRIKEINSNIKIVAISALAYAKEKEQSFSAGCDNYLSKPIDKIKLFEILKTYLSD